MKKKVTIIYKPKDGGESKTVIIELIIGDGINQSGCSIREQLRDLIDSFDFDDPDMEFKILIDADQKMLDIIQEKAENFKLIIPEYKNHSNLNWMVIIVYHM